MNVSLLDEYGKKHRRVLVPVARQLEKLLCSQLSGVARIDRIYARAKSPERFVAKAERLKEDGSPKYSSPLVQIQDLIGARIVVLYLPDVAGVGRQILKYFRHIEQLEIVPESEWEFGYFGQHYVLALPTEAVPTDLTVGDAPRFFELQVKTLFQHAWSEAEHDLGYKGAKGLTADQKRELAFTSAQAWGADRVFAELFEDIGVTEA